jgi:flagellin-like protein
MAILSRLGDKRGVSEIVGYVLLVLIAVTLSVGVYIYLKLQVPKENIKCENDATLVIDSASCRSLSGKNKELTLTLSNKGLYTVDAAYVRLGISGKKAKTWLNDPTKTNEGYFYLTNPDTGKKSLKPGEKLTLRLPPAEVQGGVGSGSGSGATNTYDLEVQPAAFTSKGLLAACPTIASQEVSCY